MADNVTVTPEELQQLKSFQARYHMLTSQYGEAHFQHKLIETELVEIDKQIDILESNRIGYMQELEKKYGVGSVNILTGEFIPSEPAPEAVSTPIINA